jgi:hypothetical protein
VKNNCYCVLEVIVVIPQNTIFFLQAYFCDCAARMSSCKHILEVQTIINMYLFLCTHKNNEFEIFSPIEGT